MQVIKFTLALSLVLLISATGSSQQQEAIEALVVSVESARVAEGDFSRLRKPRKGEARVALILRKPTAKRWREGLPLSEAEKTEINGAFIYALWLVGPHRPCVADAIRRTRESGYQQGGVSAFVRSPGISSCKD